MNINKTKLQEVIRGMKIASWEVREHSNGRRRVYVRFCEDSKPVTMKVK